MSEKLTNEQIQEKANELSALHNCKVHPLLFLDPDTSDQVIGFIKEPPRFVKLRVMDKGMTTPVTAAAEILDGYLIKEYSDPRIWDENPENDKYYIGATMEAYNLVSLSVNQFKKK